MSERKVYIGDGAYAAIGNDGDLVLTTEDGISVHNTVVIEPEAYLVLERFIEDTRAQRLGRWTPTHAQGDRDE